MLKGGTEGHVGGTEPPLDLTVCVSGLFLELPGCFLLSSLYCRINNLIHFKKLKVLMGVSLPGFPSPTLTNLIAKCLSNLVEELLSAELGKETVVRGQQGKELSKFIRLCL